MKRKLYVLSTQVFESLEDAEKMILNYYKKDILREGSAIYEITGKKIVPIKILEFKIEE